MKLRERVERRRKAKGKSCRHSEERKTKERRLLKRTDDALPLQVAEGLGANKDELSSVVSSAVNVKTAGDIVTATAQAATGGQPHTFLVFNQLL